MLGQVFATFGGFLGNVLGGGMISTIMRFAGRSLGNYLEQSSSDPEEYYHTKYHLNNLYINANTNGKTIPLVFGRARVVGNIIWATPIEEVAVNDTDLRYFKNSDDIRAIHHNTSYLYYANFAMVLCEGVVSELGRVWINGVESDISEYTYRFYNGSEDQMPDPMIERFMGVGTTPAHRGLSYIVFERLPLENFGGRIPGLSFEVTREPQNTHDRSIESNIKSMVMIPGSGEFVYDTICQDKIIYSYPDNLELYREPINYHNPKNVANSIYSLDQLQDTCVNLEWVAPVVAWFCDNLDAGNANVFPAVEYNDSSSKTTEEWRVSKFYRDNARIISRNALNVPNYGGTINDASLVRYLREVRRRGLKTMLYPMIFLDLPGKPWRGHMTSRPEGIVRFFNHPEGYKNFILHYANLAIGLVDAFIIGSEMKSLTKVRECERFPAVEELIDLAQQVKEVLGTDVKVTYAADWSEYHHTNGGYYNMDALWASEAIDFIGIDAYFPLTNSTVSDISIEDIKQGWQSGEGYDYYIDHAKGQKQRLAAEWAWKNIEYWWKNFHRNADGTETSWIPRSKKIWFTEFGPSIDKASNQPNVFFDPNSLDGGMPRHSNGEVDFEIQKKSIEASLDFWKNSEFLERMFLWTWDARPYPAWPHGNIWADRTMWLRGHWVNGKIGVSNMGSILLELCARGGINQKKVHIDSIDDVITGVVITKQSSIWDVMSIMRLGYFFDVRSDYLDRVEFVKRGTYESITIEAGSLVKSNDDIVQITDISQDNTLHEISMSFPDDAHEYCYNIVRIAREQETNRQVYYINLPIIMDENAARNLASRVINCAQSEDKIFQFTVTIEYLLRISPGDVLMLNIYSNLYRIRVTDVMYSGLLLDILGVFDSKNISVKSMPFIPKVKIATMQDEYFEIFELPESLSGRLMNSIYAAASRKCGLYTILTEKIKITDLAHSDIGILRAVVNNSNANFYVVDEMSHFTICCKSEINSSSEYQAAMIGDELIYFRHAHAISENLYMISSLIRGAKFTDVLDHVVGERFVLMKNISDIPVSDMLDKMHIKFQALSKEKILNFKRLQNNSLKIRDVALVKKDTKLEIQWKGQMKNIDGWRDARNDLEYRIIHESGGKVQEFYTKNNIFFLEGISADSKVDIVTMQRGLAESEKLQVL